MQFHPTLCKATPIDGNFLCRFSCILFIICSYFLHDFHSKLSFLMKSYFVWYFYNTFYDLIDQIWSWIMCLQSSGCSLHVKCWMFVNLKISLIEKSQVLRRNSCLFKINQAILQDLWFGLLIFINKVLGMDQVARRDFGFLKFSEIQTTKYNFDKICSEYS